MFKTIPEAFSQFCDEREDGKKMSFSKFAKLRPARTKTAKHNKIRNCCCEYCANVQLKVEASNAFLQKIGRPNLSLGTKYSALNQTLCPKTDTSFHAPACINRSCEICGIKLLRQKLQPVLDDHAGAMVTWKRWSVNQEEYQQRDGTKTKTSRRMLSSYQGPLDELWSELESELKPFALHIANAEWQHRQFSDLKDNLPDDWLLLVMDFGENYSCFYQDEAQSAHWTREQVTIHPVVAFYHCLDDDEIIHESFMCISNDHKHDANAVKHFQETVTRDLLNRGHSFEKVVHFSDGCASQYKGKTSFVDASFAETDTGVPVEKHFFGSRHGKGPCDAEIGVLKRIASMAVKRRQAVIASAEDLFRFGLDKLKKPLQTSHHSHSRRSFHFFPEGTINRTRPGRTGNDIKTLQGTRSLHCVRGIAPFVVSCRERSCFCKACTSQEGRCRNENICGPWRVASLQNSRSMRPRNLPATAPGDTAIDAVDPAPGDTAIDAVDPAPAPDADVVQSSSTEDSPIATSTVQFPCFSRLALEQRSASSPSSSLPDIPASSDVLPENTSVAKTRYQYGSWVRAKFQAEGSRQPAKFYNGMVLQTDGQEAQVKFLRNRGNLYSFPATDDIAWVSEDQITVLEPPTMDNRGHHIFR